MHDKPTQNSCLTLLPSCQRPHWWCQHRDISYQLLYLFQYTALPLVLELRRVLSSQLSACRDCVDSYVRAKAELRLEYVVATRSSRSRRRRRRCRTGHILAAYARTRDVLMPCPVSSCCLRNTGTCACTQY